MNATVKNVAASTKATASKWGEAAKRAATSDAAKQAAKTAGVVVGGAALLGVGYAVFAKTANAVYSALS